MKVKIREIDNILPWVRGFKTNALNIDLSYLMNASDVNNPLENSLRFSFLLI